MKILFEMCLVFCVIFALQWQCIDSAFRGRGASRGRVAQTYKPKGASSNSGSSGGGLFGWFRGGSNSNKNNAVGAKSASPTSLSHRDRVAQSSSHIGFAAYGNNYESNFHHNRPDHNQFRPMSHPYQSHFQPQTTAVFAYHFMPSAHIHHIHHYYGDGSSSSSSTNSSIETASHEPFFYDYRKSSSTPSVKEPIIYDYKPPYVNETSSEEDETNVLPTNPDDVFIVGVENMLFYGDMKENQHQVVFVTQGSDGISFEAELLSKLNLFESDDNDELFYFPDVEFRFDADGEPDEADLDSIYLMYKTLVDDGRC